MALLQRAPCHAESATDRALVVGEGGQDGAEPPTPEARAVILSGGTRDRLVRTS